MQRELEYELESQGEWYLEAEGPNDPQPPQRRASTARRNRRRADDPPYIQRIWHQLSIRPSRGDDLIIRIRKNTLGSLFAALSPQKADELYQRLRVRRANDELSRAFHHALATATRQQLLLILWIRKTGWPLYPAMQDRILRPRSTSREFEAELLYELEQEASTPNFV